MGAGASTVAKEESSKPLDGSDLESFEQAKEEVIRLRKMIAEHLEKSSTRRGSASKRRGSKQKAIPQFEGTPAELENAIKEIYMSYCSYGAGRTGSANVGMQLENSKFAKLAKECKLLDKKFTTTNIDLIFTKVKAKGAKKIGFQEFMQALELVAEQKHSSLEAILNAIVASGGPKSSGTKAEYNRFFDDKSTYGAGVHAHGGPSTNDNNITLSNLTDRDNKANVRGAIDPNTAVTK